MLSFPWQAHSTIALRDVAEMNYLVGAEADYTDEGIKAKFKSVKLPRPRPPAYPRPRVPAPSLCGACGSMLVRQVVVGGETKPAQAKKGGEILIKGAGTRNSWRPGAGPKIGRVDRMRVL